MKIEITDPYAIVVLLEAINFRLDHNKPGEDAIISKEFHDQLKSLRSRFAYDLAHAANQANLTGGKRQ